MRFKDPKYVGDPINAVQIFNDKEVDELVLLDIAATREGRGPAVRADRGGRRASASCRSPTAAASARRGRRGASCSWASRRSSSTRAAVERPAVRARGAARVRRARPSSCRSTCARKLLGRYEVFAEAGRRGTGLDPVDYARRMEAPAPARSSSPRSIATGRWRATTST